MTTSTGKEQEPLALLTHLIELDYDAIEGYQAAIDRLQDPDLRTPLEEFKDDHQRHVQRLSALVHRLGAVPPAQADLKGLLTKGKVVLANLGGDRAILSAMHSNERDTSTAYARAVGRPDLGDELHELLAIHLADEDRHRNWLSAKLRKLESG